MGKDKHVQGWGGENWSPDDEAGRGNVLNKKEMQQRMVVIPKRESLASVIQSRPCPSLHVGTWRINMSVLVILCLSYDQYCARDDTAVQTASHRLTLDGEGTISIRASIP